MKVFLAGNVDEPLQASLRRRVSANVVTRVPEGEAPFVAVVVGDGMPSGLIDDPRLLLLVLVEPGNPLRDLAIRRLAARVSPALEVVEHVRAALHAERTWAIVQSLAFGFSSSVAAMHASPVDRSDLVQSGPATSNEKHVLVATLAGLKLGLLGFGPMARDLAQRARAGGVEILYWPQFDDRSLDVEHEGAALLSGACKRSFDAVLTESDIVVLDLDYTEGTIRIVDAAALAAMQRDALLVNTSHGRAIDEGSLIQALRAGHLAGVALDSFNYEPLPEDSPLRSFENVLLTPGVAIPGREAVANETARRIAMAIARWSPEVAIRKVRRQVRRRNHE